MKKVVFIIATFALMLTTVSAQTTTKPTAEDYLTPAQKEQLMKDLQIAELEKKLEVYGKWVGVGGEIGTAIDEGLNAVVDVADKFGKTDVGKFTLVMIAWKIIGKDIIRIVLGLLFFTAVTWLFVRVYRNSYQPKKVPKVRVPLFKRFTTLVEYEIIYPEDNWEGYHAMKFVMLFLYAGAIGITYAIMFAG
jgi:hypothetical protein